MVIALCTMSMFCVEIVTVITFAATLSSSPQLHSDDRHEEDMASLTVLSSLVSSREVTGKIFNQAPGPPELMQSIARSRLWIVGILKQGVCDV